jgi:hypothetical protein
VGIIIACAAVIVLACAAGFLFYRRRWSLGGSTPPVQKIVKDAEMGAVEAELSAGLNPVGSTQFDPDKGFRANEGARALCAK